MSESSLIPLTSTRFEINEAEAERRLDELEPIARLAHVYSRVKRITTMPDGNFETDGDHVVQLQLVALAYVTKYHPEVDAGRLTTYLLLHDIVEAVVGDTPTLGADEGFLQAKDEREAIGMIELEAIFRDFPVLMQYLKDYEQIRDPEAAIGKALDKVMPGFSHANDGGSMIRSLGFTSYQQLEEGSAAGMARLEVYAQAFQDVIMMRKQQLRRVAQIAFKSIVDEHGTTS